MTKPKFSIWEAINIALALSSKALVESRVPGPAGRDGKDGADAALYDDWDEKYEDEGRTLVKTYLLKGEPVKVFRHVTRNTIWRGVHNAETMYQPGDLVTWGGSLWHCNKEFRGLTPDSNHFSLAVKGSKVKPEDVARHLLESKSDEFIEIIRKLLADRT